MEFYIQELTDRTEKQKFIEECDDAYTISVTGRSFYLELLDKLDKKAVMLGVYSENGEIAGYSAFYANDMENKRAFLTLFCIKKSMQRNHLGSRLIQASINEASTRGMTRMRLEVLEKDIGAINFYTKNGFVIKGYGTENFFIMERQI